MGSLVTIARQLDAMSAEIVSHLEAKEGEEYGADRVSPLPRPGTGDGIEGTQRSVPGFILKPIPVNTRSMRTELTSIVNAETPSLTKWLYSTWNAQADVIKDQEIRNAIRDGEILPSWVESWRQDYSRLITEKLAPTWEASMMSGAQRLINGIDGLGLEHDFALLGPQVEGWISSRGASLVADVTQAQADALRALLRRHVAQQPLSPSRLAQLVRPVIGLTTQENAAVSRLYTSLLDDGVPNDRALSRALDKASFLRRRRAERIARTEIAYAYNNGAFEAMKSLDEDPDVLFPGEIWVKEWSANLGPRTCPWCAELDGQIVGLVETFPAVTRRIPNTFVPPAHPNCRCVILYEIATPEEIADQVGR